MPGSLFIASQEICTQSTPNNPAADETEAQENWVSSLTRLGALETAPGWQSRAVAVLLGDLRQVVE